MNTNNQNTEKVALLVKYLADEAKAEERTLVEDWIAANEANRRYFEHFKLLWEAGQRLAQPNGIDEDEAWKRFRESVKMRAGASPLPTFRVRFLQAAAVLLVVAAAAMVATWLIKPRAPLGIPKPAEKHPASAKNDSTLKGDSMLANGPILKKDSSYNTGNPLKKKLIRDSPDKRRPEKALPQKDATIQPKTSLPPDILLKPDTLQKMAREPASWPLFLERFSSPDENLAIRKAIIRHLLGEITTQQLAGQVPITSFRLNENEFFVNEMRQPDSVRQWYKAHFITQPGFFIYFGGPRREGKGVYLARDSL